MKHKYTMDRAPRGYGIQDDMYVSMTFAKRGYIPAKIKTHADHRLIRTLKKYTYIYNKNITDTLFYCKFGGVYQTKVRRTKQ